MLFNSYTVTASFLLHHCLKAKTLVKLEMPVVSEQLQYLDKMADWWLRGEKAGEKNHNVCISSRRWNYLMGRREVTAIHWLSGAT